MFHAECHGVSKAEVARNPMMACRQHSCTLCFRSTGDAGGMLFRCQTCPQAFCEDCLPQDDIDAIGDTLPELFVASSSQFQLFWTNQRFLFTACFSDTMRPKPYTSFAVMTVRMTLRGTLPCGNPGSRTLRRRKRS